MNLLWLARALSLPRLTLRLASFLVPFSQRGEWLAEWCAELWHVRQSAASQSQTQRLLPWRDPAICFCLGAFQDAFWLRREQPPSLPLRIARPGSPSRCIFSLAALGAICILLCVSLPGPRQATLRSPYPNPDELVTISQGGYSSAHLPTIRLADYEAWTHTARRLYTDIAFYQVLRKRVRFATRESADLTVGRTSANLFDVLSYQPIEMDAEEQASQADLAHAAFTPAVILSRRAWQKYLHGDDLRSWKTLDIAGRKMTVLGVTPEDNWQLPGEIDAWIVEDNQQLHALPPYSRGYVIARVNASGFPAGHSGERSMLIAHANGMVDRYHCISLAEQARRPFAFFLFTVLLACLALPATTPLPLGEYPVHHKRTPSSARFRRWMFLAVKLALILPIAYFGSLDVAYSALPLYSPAAEYVQLTVSFFGLLFALRWTLQDQRKRCPVCLRLLTSPARVGQASHNFLAWNGTELICSVGHGLLHIPELPTSWFATQRWLYLDPSWNGLFVDGHLASAGLL